MSPNILMLISLKSLHLWDDLSALLSVGLDKLCEFVIPGV